MRKESTLRTTLAVSLVILISKASGFIREIIMAAYYGTSAQMDAYNAAYGLYYVPVLLFNSCITSALIPMYMKAQNESDLRANQFASNVTTLAACASLIVSGLMMLLTGPLVRLIYGGFDAERLSLTADLTRIMLPSLMFIVTSIVLSSILNAREKYMSAQLTGFPITIALITATVGFSAVYGAKALAWGVFFSGILQVVILLPFILPVFRFRPRLDLRDDLVKSLVVLAGPAILSMAVNELNHLIDRSLASGLPGGALSGMNYAYKLITFIMGVLLVPLTTIMFSRMSKKAAAGDTDAVKRMLGQSVDVLGLITLPIIAIGAVLTRDLIRLAYMRGQFDAQSLSVTSTAFVFYLVGLLGFGLRDMFNRTFHSQSDTMTPMINAAGTVVLNIVLNLILVRVMGVGGLALATSVSSTLGAASLFFLLRRKMGRLDGRKRLVELVKMAIASGLSAIAAIVLNRAVPQAEGVIWLILRLMLVGGCSLLVYLGAVLALRVEQVTWAAKKLLRRK